MGKDTRSDSGDGAYIGAKREGSLFGCTTEGCIRPAKAKTRPGLCNACRSRAHYHKKHPEAPYRDIGHHGKWKGKICIMEGCGQPARTNGMCQSCYDKTAYWRRKAEGIAYCPERRSRTHLKMQYGITGDDYDRMFAEQGGVCAICSEPPHEGNTPKAWKVRRLAVDHCHSTGKVRALLCNSCNLIVKERNTPELLTKAIEYLRAHAQQDHVDNT